MTQVATLAEIWRFPVKSMRGERLSEAEVGSQGLEGDRAHAVYDSERAVVLSAKRSTQLLGYRATLSNGRLLVEGPDGTSYEPGLELDRHIAGTLQRNARLVGAGSVDVPLVEIGESSATTEGEPNFFRGHRGSFFDLTDLHLVSRSSLTEMARLAPGSDFHPARFRANFVLDTSIGEGFVEEGWIGRTIAIGERVKAHVVKACSRCVMTTLAQDGLDRDRSILRTIARENSNNLGIRADVTDGGRVREGDEVRLLD